MISKKPNLRKAQAEERRIQILDTALTVFASKGFEGTSIKDIAEAAGISQGLMYHYFSSKTDLLEAAVERHSFVPQLRLILNDAKKRPINEVFNDIALKFLDMLDRKSNLVRIFIHEIESNPAVKKAWANLCLEGTALLQEYLESRVAEGEIRSHNTEVTARCLFGVLFMFHFTQDVFRSSQVSREEYVTEALANLLRGIRQS